MEGEEQNMIKKPARMLYSSPEVMAAFTTGNNDETMQRANDSNMTNTVDKAIRVLTWTTFKQVHRTDIQQHKIRAEIAADVGVQEVESELGNGLK